MLPELLLNIIKRLNMSLIISIIALAVAIVALIIAIKSKKDQDNNIDFE
jgi:hypothetical protein